VRESNKPKGKVKNSDETGDCKAVYQLKGKFETTKEVKSLGIF